MRHIISRIGQLWFRKLAMNSKGRGDGLYQELRLSTDLMIFILYCELKTCLLWKSGTDL